MLWEIRNDFKTSKEFKYVITLTDVYDFRDMLSLKSKNERTNEELLDSQEGEERKVRGFTAVC